MRYWGFSHEHCPLFVCSLQRGTMSTDLWKVTHAHSHACTHTHTHTHTHTLSYTHWNTLAHTHKAKRNLSLTHTHTPTHIHTHTHTRTHAWENLLHHKWGNDEGLECGTCVTWMVQTIFYDKILFNLKLEMEFCLHSFPFMNGFFWNVANILQNYYL